MHIRKVHLPTTPLGSGVGAPGWGLRGGGSGVGAPGWGLLVMNRSSLAPADRKM